MDYSQITEDLFIGTTPLTRHYDELRALGVSLVINMRLESLPRRDRHEPPMKTLWLPSLDTPLVPIPIRILQRGVQAALETFEHGDKVYVHCAAGVHRSVAMAAAILIARGHTVESAIGEIKRARPVADPEAWYLLRRIRRFAELWDGKETR